MFETRPPLKPKWVLALQWTAAFIAALVAIGLFLAGLIRWALGDLLTR